MRIGSTPSLDPSSRVAVGLDKEIDGHGHRPVFVWQIGKHSGIM